MRRFYLITYLILLPFFIFSGCDKKQTQENNNETVSYFDPKIPWGIIKNYGNIFPVQEVNVTTNVGSNSLTWKVPELYKNQIYKVLILRNDCDAKTDSTCTTPDPRLPATAFQIFKIFEGTGKTHTDSYPGNSGDYFSYWIYIYISVSDEFGNNIKRWSDPVLVTYPKKVERTITSIPDAAVFWTKKAWSFGTPQDNWAPNVFALKKTTTFSVNQGTGEVLPLYANSVAIAKKGTVMYVADTANNRIVIYAKKMAMSCFDLYPSGGFEQDICMLQAAGMPYEPVNVIGQPNQNSNTPCHTQCFSFTNKQQCENYPAVSHSYNCVWEESGVGGSCSPAFGMDRCLSAPSGVVVDGNNLIISDTGNNRIVVWDHLPTTGGCDIEVMLGQTTPLDCEPKGVYIGGHIEFNKFKDYLEGDCLSKIRKTDCPTGATSNCRWIPSVSKYIYGRCHSLNYDTSTKTRDLEACTTKLDAETCAATKGAPDWCPSITNQADCDSAKNGTKTIGGCSWSASSGTCSSVSGSNLCEWLTGSDEKDYVYGCSNKYMDKIFNKPTGIVVSGSDLYVSDTGFNRVVRIKDYAASSPPQCAYDDILNTSGCRVFDSVIGQRTKWEDKTFKKMIEDGRVLLDSAGQGNKLSTKDSKVLLRYFASPGKLQIASNGKLLVSSYENYKSKTTDGFNYPMELHGRILAFDMKKLSGSSSFCNEGTFESGGCDADIILGQEQYNKIPTFTEMGGYYSDVVPFGLQAVGGFFEFAKQLMAIDPVTNNIYSWTNYTSGPYYDAKIKNPLGVIVESLNLPNLKSTSDIVLSVELGKIYVYDSKQGQIYEINASSTVE